jgi:hypothetical protein
MLRISVVSIVALVASFSLPTPSMALPICSGSTLADYVASGSCQAGKLSFLSFSYEGTPSAEDVFASVGGGGISLTAFAWGAFGLSFTVTGPGIARNELSMVSSFIGPFDTGSSVSMLTTPGGLLSVAFSRACVLGTAPPDECRFFDRIDFAPVDSQFVQIAGGAGAGAALTDVAVEFGVVPEPATLLLFGTTAAGLGVARWLKRRRVA